MKRRTKVIIGTTMAVVVFAVASANMMARRRSGVEVRIEEVRRQDLVASVTASGWIRPRRTVDVQADIMGRITELHVEEGQVVRRGDILLRIDPTQYEAAVARARAAVSEALARQAQARANLIQAERALERARAIAARDSTLVSAQQLEEAETNAAVQRELFEAARYLVEQARAALGEAEDRLAKTTIRAPMDGVITRLNVEEGETAIVGTMNNPGSLLLTISDLSVMEAVVRVDETDVPLITLGDSAVIRIDAYRRETFTGRVTEIGHSAVNPPSSMMQTGAGGQSVDFEVVITLDNPPASLRPDLSATAEIITARRDNVLAIPIIALTVREAGDLEPIPQEGASARAAAADRTRTDQEGVFVVREGKVEFRPVRIGITGREHFEVLEGLAEGDSIVAGPYDVIRTLQNGQVVRPMTTAPSASADARRTGS